MWLSRTEIVKNIHLVFFSRQYNALNRTSQNRVQYTAYIISTIVEKIDSLYLIVSFCLLFNWKKLWNHTEMN